MELIYVIEGTVNCNVNNNSYQLNKGDFGLCLPYNIHRYVPEDNTLYWVIVFSEEYVRYFAKQIADKTGDGFQFRCKEPVERYINEQLINNEAPSIFSLKSCLYAVCEEYLKNIKLIDKDRKEEAIITLVSDYIFENHTKKLSLSDIAKKLGYDYNYISRLFRRFFNMTFTDFVNIYRLETAIKLLEDTDDSITTIAFESGFQSVRNFNVFFKKNMKTSPSQYRSLFRKSY